MMCLVSENLLNKRPRQLYEKIHGRIYTLWDEYEGGERTTASFLQASSSVTGLGPNPTSLN